MAAIRPVGNPLVPGPDDFSAAVEHLGTDEDPSMHPDRALEAFWAEEAERAFAVQAASTADAAEVFKFANDLPLARIKRIMKSDEDVRLISAEAPIVFAKACEMFIADLTVRAYGFSTVSGGGSPLLRALILSTQLNVHATTGGQGPPSHSHA